MDPEAPWSFRLNELCRRGIRNTGILATLQALCMLEMTRGHRGDGMFLHVPPQDLFEARATEPVAEVDLFLIINGKLVLGEVKSNPQGFSEDVVSKTVEVAQELEPDELYFAAPGKDWPPDVMARIDAARVALASRSINVQPLHLEWV